MTPEQQRATDITTQYYRRYFRAFLVYLARQFEKLDKDGLHGCLQEAFLEFFRFIRLFGGMGHRKALTL